MNFWKRLMVSNLLILLETEEVPCYRQLYHEKLMELLHSKNV